MSRVHVHVYLAFMLGFFGVDDHGMRATLPLCSRLRVQFVFKSPLYTTPTLLTQGPTRPCAEPCSDATAAQPQRTTAHRSRCTDPLPPTPTSHMPSRGCAMGACAHRPILSTRRAPRLRHRHAPLHTCCAPATRHVVGAHSSLAPAEMAKSRHAEEPSFACNHPAIS